jgi:hypothetical protein
MTSDNAPTTENESRDIRRISNILAAIRQHQPGTTTYDGRLVYRALEIMKLRPDISPFCAVMSAYLIDKNTPDIHPLAP